MPLLRTNDRDGVPGIKLKRALEIAEPKPLKVGSARLGTEQHAMTIVSAMRGCT